MAGKNQSWVKFGLTIKRGVIEVEEADRLGGAGNNLSNCQKDIQFQLTEREVH